MPRISFTMVETDDDAAITVLVPGHDAKTATPGSHPNFEQIKTALLTSRDTDPEAILDMFALDKAIQRQFAGIGERYSLTDDQVYFDGDPVDDALAQQILRFWQAGVIDWQPLVAFGERVAANPNEHSREQLWNWLRAADFTITPGGKIIGYKGVEAVGDNQYRSISSGTAVVDGTEHHGRIPQELGSVVEMPRSEVQHDPSRGCHTGLHVGTWEYASGFARGAVLKVVVDPRDVVSVPTDCGAQKMRCCRYQVLDVLDAPISGPLDLDYADEDDEDDEYMSYFEDWGL